MGSWRRRASSAALGDVSMDVRTGGAKVAIHGRDDELFRLREVRRRRLSRTAARSPWSAASSASARPPCRRKCSAAPTPTRSLVDACLSRATRSVRASDGIAAVPAAQSLRGFRGRSRRQWPRAFLDFVPYEFIGNRADDAQRIDDAQLSSSGQSRLFEWLLTVLCQLAAERAGDLVDGGHPVGGSLHLGSRRLSGSQPEYGAGCPCC